MKKIVVIGAGYAGVLTAKKLAKKFKKSNDVEITIIDKRPFHTMLTELHEVAAARVDEDSIKISLQKVFAGRKVKVVLDTVQSVDYEKRLIEGTHGSYTYDYLVLAAGSRPTYYGVKGAEEYSYKLWSYEDAVILKERIEDVFRQASMEPDEKKRRKLLTFYMVGAGFTGVEMIGELAEYTPILCEKFEIAKDEVTLVNVDGLSRPIPNLPEKLSKKVEKRLTKMGVTLKMSSFVSAIGKDFIELKQGDEIVRYDANTIIWGAGIESCELTAQAASSHEMQRGGRVQVDKYLRSVKDDHVYVIGDNMYYVPEGEERPVPQMVENCEQSAVVAANNIAAAVKDEKDMKEYKPSFHGVMVCIGGRYGVAHVGLPGHFFSLPSFLAMFAKHFINIIYFIQVLGWNKIFSYMKHEFFTVRHCRSFVGGHFSNRTPSFLLVLLRVWLGAVWVFEGVMKIVEGWFTKLMLNGFFGGANAWYDSILNSPATAKAGEAASAVADAASAATTAAATAAPAAADAASAATGAADAAGQAVAAVGHALINWDIFGILRVIFVTGKDISASTLADYAFKLDIRPMDWFINTFILPNDGVQLAMQIFIVLAEILVGLALMGGLLSTPAAAFSLVLQFMFVTTTGLYLNSFWMIFAGIAVLIGAGRTFGLDYYAMPWLKKKWKKVKFAKKWYIYND